MLMISIEGQDYAHQYQKFLSQKFFQKPNCSRTKVKFSEIFLPENFSKMCFGDQIACMGQAGGGGIEQIPSEGRAYHYYMGTKSWVLNCCFYWFN